MGRITSVGTARAGVRTWIGWLVLLSVVAVWLRVSMYESVMIGGRPLPTSPDVYYHLRRVGLAMATFPVVPVKDSLLNWPEGALCPWAPGFTWAAAAFAILVGGSASPEQSVVFFPVFLGLLAVLATVATARLLLRPHPRADAISLGAGFIAAVLPHNIALFQVAEVDHHGFEALAVILLGGWVLWAAKADPGDSREDDARWLKFELVGALLLFVLMASYSGGILHAAFAAALLSLLRLAGAEPRWRRKPLLGTGVIAYLAAAGLLAWLHAGEVALRGKVLDYVAPSYLQPLLLALVGAGCYASALATGYRPASASGLRGSLARLALFVGILAATAAVLAAIFPAMARETVRGLTEWLLRRDPTIMSIMEFQSPVRRWGIRDLSFSLSPGYFAGFWGWAGFVTVPAGLVLVIRQHRRSGLCFLGWTLFVLVLAAMQIRFCGLFMLNLAILSSVSAFFLAERIAGSKMPATAIFAVGLAAVVAVDPQLHARFFASSERTLTADEEVVLFLESLSAPREHEKGVVAMWSVGHPILHRGRHPVLATGFIQFAGASGFREADRVLSGGESELVALMERRRMSYLSAGYRDFNRQASLREVGESHPSGRSRVTMRLSLTRDFYRSVQLSPLVLGGSGIPSWSVPHIRHFLPRFVSSNWDEIQPGLPVFERWLYEYVPGARVTGKTQPGSRVTLSTQIAARGRILPYLAWADADREGNFVLELAVPSSWQGGGLEVGPSYDVWFGEQRQGSVLVPESAVRGAKSIRIGPVQPADQSTRGE